MERFLIAHEFGHAVIGTDTKPISNPEPNAEGMSEWDLNRSEEFEADAMAARIVIEFYRQQGFSPGRSLWPVFAMFAAIDHAYRLRHIAEEDGLSAGRAAFFKRFTDQNSERNFHPAPMDRAYALLQIAKKEPDALEYDLEQRWGVIALIMKFLNDALEEVASTRFLPSN